VEISIEILVLFVQRIVREMLILIIYVARSAVIFFTRQSDESILEKHDLHGLRHLSYQNVDSQVEFIAIYETRIS